MSVWKKPSATIKLLSMAAKNPALLHAVILREHWRMKVSPTKISKVPDILRVHSE